MAQFNLGSFVVGGLVGGTVVAVVGILVVRQDNIARDEDHRQAMAECTKLMQQATAQLNACPERVRQERP